jgi:PIN domain nuclease of toxin-antitoxin system
LAIGGGQLTSQTLKAIDESETVSVSSISAFEIALSHKKGKLELPCAPDKWYQDVLSHHDIIEIKLDSKIAIASTKLPDHHKDPCDRFIIATAILSNLPIITKDKLFERYGVKMHS